MEKFWRSLELGIIIVVYGVGNYLLEAPSRSYINVEDFKSTEKLARFRKKKVGENETKYGKYFEWRKYYTILNQNETRTKDWCGLCKAI